MAAKRSSTSSDAVQPPAPKRERPSGPSVGALQRELGLERERHERAQESVEQLRLEVQMMGRLLAASRERLVACGAAAFAADTVVRVPPPQPVAGGPGGSRAGGRSKADAKLLQRLQEELAESRGQCARLTERLERQERRMSVASASQKELMSVVTEMNVYLTHNR